MQDVLRQSNRGLPHIGKYDQWLVFHFWTAPHTYQKIEIPVGASYSQGVIPHRCNAIFPFCRNVGNTKCRDDEFLHRNAQFFMTSLSILMTWHMEIINVRSGDSPFHKPEIKLAQQSFLLLIGKIHYNKFICLF